jgi:4-methyl-5(b-hydroxyethyl)-thiazole monophosphate biosynthesis
MTLVPETTLDELEGESFDMVVLPGGLPGSDHLDQDPRVRRILQHTAAGGGYTAAICAAPKALASAGLLNGKKATGYPGVLQNMDLPQVDVGLEAVVTDDKVVTSRGPGTAMDFALELIRLLAGKEKRDEVEAGLVR